MKLKRQKELKVTVGAKVPRSMRDRLERMAKVDKRNVSFYVIEALSKYLATRSA